MPEQKKPSLRRGEVAMIFAIIMGLLLGVMIKRVKVGILIGLVLGITIVFLGWTRVNRK